MDGKEGARLYSLDSKAGGDTAVMKKNADEWANKAEQQWQQEQLKAEKQRRKRRGKRKLELCSVDSKAGRETASPGLTPQHAGLRLDLIRVCIRLVTAGLYFT